MEGGPALIDALPWSDARDPGGFPAPRGDTFASSVLNSTWLWGKGTAVPVDGARDNLPCTASYRGLLGDDTGRQTPAAESGSLMVLDVRACAAELPGSDSSGSESPPRLMSVGQRPPPGAAVPSFPMSMLLPPPRQGQNHAVKVTEDGQAVDDVRDTRFTSLESTHDILETVANMLEIPHDLEETVDGCHGDSPYSCGQMSGATPLDSPLSVLSNHSSYSSDVTQDVATTMESFASREMEGIMTSLTAAPIPQMEPLSMAGGLLPSLLPPVSQVLNQTSLPPPLTSPDGIVSSVHMSQTLTSGGTVTTLNDVPTSGSMMGFLNSDPAAMDTGARPLDTGAHALATKHYLEREHETSPKRIKREATQHPEVAEGQRSGVRMSSGHGRGGKKGTCLPPCKVCGARGTGFHYGVTTCEACKGFFRRCLTRKHSPVCHGKGSVTSNCDIAHGVANACPFCRYQKCLSVGMSVKAIRLGRYTLSKKTQDIIEVKHLEAREKHEKHETERAGEVESFIEQVMVAHREIMDWWKSTPGVDDLENFKRQITESGTHPCDPRDDAPLSTEDFLALYQRTGVKADARIEKISLWGELFEVGVTRLVQFIKKVPGFRKLGSADQLHLIKSSYMENVIIGRYSLFDPSDRKYYAADGARIQPFGLDVVLGQEMTSRILTVAAKLRKLNPTYEELVFLKMINIFSTERHSFEDPGPVKETHEQCLEALLYVIKNSSRHDVSTSPGIRFAKMIDVLMEVRSFNHDVSLFFKKTILTFTESQLITLPPLFGEIVKSA